MEKYIGSLDVAIGDLIYECCCKLSLADRFDVLNFIVTNKLGNNDELQDLNELFVRSQLGMIWRLPKE